jgi:hypothetical protein
MGPNGGSVALDFGRYPEKKEKEKGNDKKTDI